MRFNVTLSARYSSALACGAGVALFFLLGSFGHPVGQKVTGIAVLGFLATIVMMVIRRPQSPTQADLWLLRIGFVPLFFLAVFIVRNRGFFYDWIYK